MHALLSEAIENYVLKHSSAEPSLLRQLSKETHQKTELPQMMVGPVEGGFLKLLARLVNARRILEIGTFTGYSSLCMAEALPKNGKLVTLDINPKNVAIAKRFWSKSTDGKKIQSIVGSAVDSLKTVKGPFDLVFIDADKGNYINYWKACVPKVRHGGLLVADNVLWSGRVLHPKDSDDHAIVRFNRHVLKDKRVDAVMLTVRDGMTLAWKK